MRISIELVPPSHRPPALLVICGLRSRHSTVLFLLLIVALLLDKAVPTRRSVRGARCGADPGPIYYTWNLQYGFFESWKTWQEQDNQRNARQTTLCGVVTIILPYCFSAVGPYCFWHVAVSDQAGVPDKCTWQTDGQLNSGRIRNNPN